MGHNEVGWEGLYLVGFGWSLVSEITTSSGFSVLGVRDYCKSVGFRSWVYGITASGGFLKVGDQ